MDDRVQHHITLNNAYETCSDHSKYSVLEQCNIFRQTVATSEVYVQLCLDATIHLKITERRQYHWTLDSDIKLSINLSIYV